jgi:Domain of unknown function (DUF4190)
VRRARTGNQWNTLNDRWEDSMSTATPEQREHTEPAARSPIDQHPSPVAETGRKSGKATASLVLGIIGVIASMIPIAGWVLGGIALGLGITARSQIRQRGLTGMGIATAGTILGVIAILAGVGFAVLNVALMT